MNQLAGGPRRIRTEMDEAWRAAHPWDGRQLGYAAPAEAIEAPGVRFFDQSESADPVTYQVLRWKLWNINLEHSETIKRVSGSPAIVYMDDFATSILTARGENLVCGPTIQYFTGLADLVVKWTLENRAVSPGICEGDVFLQNDPYVGTAHQMDACLYMPVFWDGALFCWVFNSAHQGDIGGMSPGSFCVGARDVFDEPTPVPPVKLVRGGVLQDDVAELFVRKSRTPETVALQLRSQVAGLNAARDRVLGLLEQYGPKVVNGVMHRMIDDCAAILAERLGRLPDGVFEQVTYVGGLTPTDTHAHRYRLEIRKEGGLLHCTNEGTDPQFGAANCTYAAWRSGIICAVSSILAYDQMCCPAGVLSALRFAPHPGLLNCARYPAAVTTVVSTTVGVYMASQVVSRIVLTGPPEIAETAIAAGASSVTGTWVLSALDASGRRVAEATGEGIAGGMGASRFRDGIDNGGAWYMPRNVSGDVEEWEQSIPLLYVYRREHVDSGGAGRRRGGNGVAAAICGHKTSEAEVITINVDTAVNATPGLGGGYPGHSGNLRSLTDSRLRELFAKGDVPADAAAVAERVGEAQRMRPKNHVRLLPQDMMLFQVCGSGGFGDPLLREPLWVAEDVARGSVSPAAATRLYGVVLADGAVDEAATKAQREGLLAARLAGAQPPLAPDSGPPPDPGLPRRAIGDSLCVAGVGEGARFACNCCNQPLGPVSGNYRLACATLAVAPADLDPEIYPDPAQFCDDELVLRQTLCPRCATLLAQDFCLKSEPIRCDVRLDPATLERS